MGRCVLAVAVRMGRDARSGTSLTKATCRANGAVCLFSAAALMSGARQATNRQSLCVGYTVLGGRERELRAHVQCELFYR